ncbi:hypothetical protein R1flu_020979 [Riccia fluitans]|uniref:Haloacid dehalogenase-like hydrolase domain-containing protein 3 n=1 Tax=Riccia fluitans TaxID=41844 RepID=A0ABD1ZQ22_9MARC
MDLNAELTAAAVYFYSMGRAKFQGMVKIDDDDELVHPALVPQFARGELILYEAGLVLTGFSVRSSVFLKNSCRSPSLRLSCAAPRPTQMLIQCASNSNQGVSEGKPAYDALLVDVGGTLLETAKPVADIYAEVGVKYGLKTSPDEIKTGFKRAFSAPWPERLRYEGDGRPFWRFAVATATGCSDEAYFEELYQLFARGEAWRVSAGAQESLVKLRDAGVKLAVVSNFDSRLRPVLRDLEIHSLFDAVIVSSEIGHEKPARQIFEAALNELSVGAGQTVHVGDDALADKAGAEALGIKSWLWKKDVKSFEEVAGRILNADGYPAN